MQLLGQLTPAAEWPKLLAYWRSRNPAGTGGWPARLEPGMFALNLWPLAAGRLGRAVGVGQDVRKRQPKRLLCTPALSAFDPSAGSDPETALAVLCASWLDDVAMSDFPAVRLAPPVLEEWGSHGRLLSRVVVDFGLDWPLARAEGVAESAGGPSLGGG